MKTLLLLITLTLSGCAEMTPQQAADTATAFSRAAQSIEGTFDQYQHPQYYRPAMPPGYAPNPYYRP